MSYMNDDCDPFGIPYNNIESKKTVKKERDKPIERFTYNGCIIYDRDNRMEVWEAVNFLNELVKENEELRARLYAEKTNTVEVINDYAKQFKRHSTQFSFMIDLAEDLDIDISKLEALDD